MKKIIYSTFDTKYLKDTFFDTLRFDYEGFDNWFTKSARQNRKAIYIIENNSVLGFAGLKFENKEDVDCVDFLTNEHKILKITTFKVSQESENKRFSEILLDKIFNIATINNINFIYLTASNETKHGMSVQNFFEKQWHFKLKVSSLNPKILNDTIVYKDSLRNRSKSRRFFFPKIPLTKIGLITIKPQYHEIIFKNSPEKDYIEFEKSQELSITKSFVTNAYNFKVGQFVLIYKANDKYCTHIAQVSSILEKGKDYKNIDDFKLMIKNKNAVYIDKDFNTWFEENASIFELKIFIKLKNKNIKYARLKNDIKTKNRDKHPNSWIISKEQVKEFVKEGSINENFIINS